MARKATDERRRKRKREAWARHKRREQAYRNNEAVPFATVAAALRVGEVGPDDVELPRVEPHHVRQRQVVHLALALADAADARDVRAALREADGGVVADAAAGAGDDEALAVEWRDVRRSVEVAPRDLLPQGEGTRHRRGEREDAYIGRFEAEIPVSGTRICVVLCDSSPVEFVSDCVGAA